MTNRQSDERTSGRAEHKHPNDARQPTTSRGARENAKRAKEGQRNEAQMTYIDAVMYAYSASMPHTKLPPNINNF